MPTSASLWFTYGYSDCPCYCLQRDPPPHCSLLLALPSEFGAAREPQLFYKNAYYSHNLIINDKIFKRLSPSVHPKGDQTWVFIGRTDAEAETPNTLATSCEELTHWKRPWCWEGLGAGGEGDHRGWDDCMASPTRWTWVWVNSGSWWWTGSPGVLWFMGMQRVGHDWATDRFYHGGVVLILFLIFKISDLFSDLKKKS